MDITSVQRLSVTHYLITGKVLPSVQGFSAKGSQIPNTGEICTGALGHFKASVPMRCNANVPTRTIEQGVLRV